MPMPVRPFTRVEVKTSPFEGGLVDVAKRMGRLIDSPSEDVASGLAVTVDALCGHPGLIDGLCNTDSTITTDDTPTYESPDWESGPVFATYRGIRCFPGTDMEDLAKKSLERNETFGVESAFQQAIYRGGEYLTTTVLPGPVPALAGLAALEHAVGEMGGGVIHVHRAGAVYLANLRAVESKDGMLVTKLGTPIVAGAGYENNSPSNSSPAERSFWAWVTPPFTLARSPIIYNEGYALNVNQQDGLAERVWTVALDCALVSAILIDPEA